MKPLQQGELDCLCGLYAIVNAMRQLARHSKPQRQQVAALFSHLIHATDRRLNLHEAVTFGIDTAPMVGLCRSAACYTRRHWGMPITVEQPYRHATELAAVAIHMQERCAAGSVFVVGMWGANDHWSVCRQVTDQSLLLFDSMGMHRLPLKNCTLLMRANSPYATRYGIPRSALIALHPPS